MIWYRKEFDTYNRIIGFKKYEDFDAGKEFSKEPVDWAQDKLFEHLADERGIDLNVNFKKGFLGGNPLKKWNSKIVKMGLDKFMKKYGLALIE